MALKSAHLAAESFSLPIHPEAQGEPTSLFKVSVFKAAKWS
jgi:hypothetical protein